MKRLLHNPKHWLWVLVHLVLILVGWIVYGQKPSDTISFAIGSSLIAAGVTGWITFAYVLFSEEISDRLRVLAEFGVVNVFDARSVRIRQEYDNRLKTARDRIDIIGFGLSALRGDFLRDFPKWKQMARVRILLLDPEFPSLDQSYALQRDNEEGNPRGDIAKDVKKFIQDVGPLIQAGAFEIRLYCTLPTVNIFRIDDDLFWGPYLLGEQSRNTPTFVVKRGGILFDRLTTHFDRIWNDDRFYRAVPTNWIEKEQ